MYQNKKVEKPLNIQTFLFFLVKDYFLRKIMSSFSTPSSSIFYALLCKIVLYKQKQQHQTFMSKQG